MWKKMKNLFSNNGKRIDDLEQRVEKLQEQMKQLEKLLEERDEKFLDRIFEQLFTNVSEDIFLGEEDLESFPSIFGKGKNKEEN